MTNLQYVSYFTKLNFPLLYNIYLKKAYLKSVFLLIVVENTARWIKGVVVSFFWQQISLQFAAIYTGVQGNYNYQVWGSTLFSHAVLHFWSLLRRNLVKGWTLFRTRPFQCDKISANCTCINNLYHWWYFL